jgi:dTDP-4-amino-4,6-dideoxygalactose transaminase
VVEDAACAVGSEVLTNGTWERVGRPHGDVACFSFHPRKVLTTGDGGMLTTNDAALAGELRLLRNHGAEPKYFHKRIGGNFRLDALQAAVLRVKLPHLPAWTAKRRENAARYMALFREAGVDDRITLPVVPDGYDHIFNQFVARVPQRDRLRARLAEQGIGTEIYYPVPFHLQECFADLGYARGAFPHAEAAAESSLALPIYAELTDVQQRAVVEGLASSL